MSEDISQHTPQSKEQDEAATLQLIGRAESAEKQALTEWQTARAKIQELEAKGQRSIEAKKEVVGLEKAYREKANAAARLRIDAREQAKQAVEQAKADKFYSQQNEKREATIKKDLLLSFVRSGLGTIQDFEAKYPEIRAEYDRQQFSKVAAGQVTSTLGIARRIF